MSARTGRLGGDAGAGTSRLRCCWSPRTTAPSILGTAGRMLWRYRSELAPLTAALILLMAGAWTHSAHPGMVCRLRGPDHSADRRFW